MHNVPRSQEALEGHSLSCCQWEIQTFHDEGIRAMQVLFLGGASGVGASCLAIELAEQWFVVDAGVRVDRKTDPLPDLAQLEGKDIRAIFVTHAHADHIGALPLLHRAFPSAPIFTSRGTALLMEVMLADALKIMAKRAVEEMELPLYPDTLVSGMLTQVRPMPVDEPFSIPMLPGITIHASRAGHIAGAVSLGFQARDGSLVVSGDISSTPQRTVLGATPPSQSPGRGAASSPGRRRRAGSRRTRPDSVFWTGPRSGAAFAVAGCPGTGPDSGVSYLCRWSGQARLYDLSTAARISDSASAAPDSQGLSPLYGSQHFVCARRTGARTHPHRRARLHSLQQRHADRWTKRLV